MKNGIVKRASLLCMLLLCALLLGGCVAQVEERAMTDLSESEIKTDVAAPRCDGAEDVELMATLYFLSEDASLLVPVSRRIAANAEAGKPMAALSALLSGPRDGEEAYWPELGDARSERFLEISDGIATVDLPAYARTLPQETLYAVRLAIAMTLTEFPEIAHVNVLVGGREEGLDLSASLPVGTFSRTRELDAAQQYRRLNDQKQSEKGVTLLTTMYFPSADGGMILPEIRSIHYAEATPIEYLYTLLDEMGEGTHNELAHPDIPSPMDYIEEMPEIVRTEDGYLAVELRLDKSLLRDLEHAGIPFGVYSAMLTDTLMGFVPGVEGLKISIDGEAVSGFEPEETPDGREIRLEKLLMTRGDFEGYVGAPVTMYVMEGEGLAKCRYILSERNSKNPRARMIGLMELSDDERFALPHHLTDSDILAVHVGKDVIAVNLSSAFARALSSLSQRYERAAVYAMINTLTEGMDIDRVAFFFDGEQTEMLSGGLEMRGTFMRNPGMVVD